MLENKTKIFGLALLVILIALIFFTQINKETPTTTCWLPSAFSCSDEVDITPIQDDRGYMVSMELQNLKGQRLTLEEVSNYSGSDTCINIFTANIPRDDSLAALPQPVRLNEVFLLNFTCSSAAFSDKFILDLKLEYRLDGATETEAVVAQIRGSSIPRLSFKKARDREMAKFILAAFFVILFAIMFRFSARKEPISKAVGHLKFGLTYLSTMIVFGLISLLEPAPGSAVAQPLDTLLQVNGVFSAVVVVLTAPGTIVSVIILFILGAAQYILGLSTRVILMPIGAVTYGLALIISTAFYQYLFGKFFRRE